MASESEMIEKENDAPVEENANNDADMDATSVALPPNHTLYVNNLNERIKPDEIKKALYAIFSTVGPVVEVQASKRLVTRGQAWIVFKELADATKAMRDLQNFLFYDKPMRINFAREKSDVIAVGEGTQVDKLKRKEESKKRRVIMDAERAKRKKVSESKSSVASVKVSLKPRNEPPNKILFVENLPAIATADALQALFGQYGGFKEVRMVPSKPGIAFVEYASEGAACIAMTGLQHFKITNEHLMVVSYARKG